MQLRIKVCTGLLLAFWVCMAQADWLPISPEELAMKSEPLAPRAPAIFLYRQVDRDDAVSSVRVYNRIKILTEEGRDYANVKIPYDKYRQTVRGIEARTIRPDGTIVEFTGKPYDQVLAKGQKQNISAKLFTLSDVQVGSIIEYRYSLSLDERYVFDSNWELNDVLFTKQAKFSLVPNDNFSVAWMWPLGLPPGTSPPENKYGKIRMETSNVPAFVEEEYMPPEAAVKMRVDFIYIELGGIAEKDPVKFWTKYGKKLYDKIDDFIDYKSELQKTVATIVKPDDTPDAKARKLYAWVQKLRNLSFERRKTDEENKREDLDHNRNVKDLLKHGYGAADEMNWLYIALARAAGLQADPVQVAPRDSYFFNPTLMNSNQLTTYVVQLNIDGTTLFVDPGTAFAPYGLLPWAETMVKGLRLDAKGGSWVLTTAPNPAQARVDRNATLDLDKNGMLTGKLRVTFYGLPALSLRINNRFDDATEHKETLEHMVKSYVPVGIDVTLVNTPDWSSSAMSMIADFDLKVSGWMQGAGSRGLFQAALFGAEIKHDFDHAARQHPIYFEYSYEFNDDVVVNLPPGWRVGTLPPPQILDLKNLVYNMWAEEQGGGLHIHRKLMQGFVILDKKFYPDLRDFFQQARDGDEQQLVLLPAASTEKKLH
jgi:hypothetical protein